MSQAGITTPKSGGGGTGVQTLTGNTGGAVSPTGNNINIIGSGVITVTGSPGTSTLTISSSASPTDLHITPYIVSAAGATNGASFTTIQSAVNAANAAGGGMVFIQPGTYTENLTLFTNIQLFGDSEQGTTIIGTHTPPPSGTLNVFRVTLQSTTNIFSSAVAGTTTIIVEDCTFSVTSGYTFNLPNWTGSIAVYDIGSNGSNDGFINNTGGATLFLVSGTLGAGMVNTMTTSGPVTMQEIDLNCPWTANTGTTIGCDYTIFTQLVTAAGSSSGHFRYCEFNTGSNPSLTMSSSGAVELTHAIINSSNNPAIAGAGAGTLTYADVIFLQNAAFAGTLTLNTVSWRPYAQAIASTNGTKVGTAAFNSAQFTVDANGFVSAAAAGIPTTITGNSGGALSPTANNWNIFGAAVAAGTTPVTTVGAGSTLTVDVQRSQAIAATNATNVGLAAFNSAQFTVDANGFVSTLGSAIPNTITGNSGGALSPTAGNWNILGASTAAGTTPVTTVGSGSTLTVDVQKSQAIAATNATNVGLAAFNSAQFTVDANGFVSALGTGITTTLTGDSGGTLSPTAGNFNILGRSGSKVSGAVSTLTIKSPPYSDQGASTTVALNTGSSVTAAITLTLPASAGLLDGDLFEFYCTTAGALVIQSVTAQRIRLGSAISGLAGTATSTAIGDSISLRFRAADGFFYATSVIGNWTIV